MRHGESLQSKAEDDTILLADDKFLMPAVWRSDKVIGGSSK